MALKPSYLFTGLAASACLIGYVGFKAADLREAREFNVEMNVTQDSEECHWNGTDMNCNLYVKGTDASGRERSYVIPAMIEDPLNLNLRDIEPGSVIRVKDDRPYIQGERPVPPGDVKVRLLDRIL